MCLPKWKNLENTFSFIFEELQRWQKKTQNNKTHVWLTSLSSALSQRRRAFPPSPPSFPGQAWWWLSFTKHTFFSLYVPPKILLHPCATSHLSIICFLSVSFSLSPIFNTHLQKMEFPWVRAYEVQPPFCGWELVVCQQPKRAWDRFPDFQGWIPIFKLRVMSSFFQKGGLPQAGYVAMKERG